MFFDRSASCIIRFEDGSEIEFKNLNIEFDVRKTLTQETNIASIKIYNLSQDSMNRVQESGSLVYLFAGYTADSGEEIIFTGNISKVVHSKQNENTTLEIESGDGDAVFRNVVIVLEYEEKVDARDILRDITTRAGITIRDYENVPFKMYQQGFAFVGQITEAIDKVTKFLGYEWSIQNNELQIVRKGKPSIVSINLVSIREGLLERPNRNTDAENRMSGDVKAPGWSLKTLLNPKYEPGGQVDIDTELIKGLFKIESVRHLGSLYSNNWTSEIDVIEVQGG